MFDAAATKLEIDIPGHPGDSKTCVEMLQCPACDHQHEAGLGDGGPEARTFRCESCGEEFLYRVEIIPVYSSWTKK